MWLAFCFLLSIAFAAPGGRIVGYLPGYKQTHIPPLDVAKAGYTHVIVAFATFNATNKGAIVNEFGPYVSTAYVASLQKAGLKVMFSLGGALTNTPGATVNFHQIWNGVPNFVTTFTGAIEKLVKQYNFDGVDIDLEQGFTSDGTPSDVDIMATVINTLHANNPSLLISLVPQAANIAPQQTLGKYLGIYASYSNLAMQTYKSITWTGVQVYNTGGMNGINNVLYSNADPGNMDFSVAMAVDMLEAWPTQDAGRPTGFPAYQPVLRPDQVMLGYPAPDAQGGSDGGPAKQNAVIKKIIQCLREGFDTPSSCDTYAPPVRNYPDFGGVFCWELTYDQSNDWKFGRELSDCVKNGNCN
jgi:chitinase